MHWFYKAAKNLFLTSHFIQDVCLRCFSKGLLTVLRIWKSTFPDTYGSIWLLFKHFGSLGMWKLNSKQSDQNDSNSLFMCCKYITYHTLDIRKHTPYILYLFLSKTWFISGQLISYSNIWSLVANSNYLLNELFLCKKSLGRNLMISIKGRPKKIQWLTLV